MCHLYLFPLEQKSKRKKIVHKQINETDANRLNEKKKINKNKAMKDIKLPGMSSTERVKS